MTFLYKTFNKNKPNNTLGAYARIPDLDVPLITLEDQYVVEKCLAEGFYAKILFTRHRDTKTQVVLKACHSEVVNLKDFCREFHYSYHLSHHPNIVNVYNVAFQTHDYFVFAMEYAPYADLAVFVGPYGIAESHCKKICEQLSAALGFLHSKKLVHRDIKLENVLVFALDFSRVKLGDFGATTRDGLLVRKTNNTWTSFLAPEVFEVVKNERFHCRSSQDVWSFGVLIYLILTGTTPWDKADWVRDAKYANFRKYQTRETQKIPPEFRKFTPRFLRAFRRLFDHDERDRAKATDVMKYIKDKWLDPKMSNSKFSTLTSYQPVSDKDSIVINLSTTNRQTKTLPIEGMGGTYHGTGRSRRLMSTVGLIMRDTEDKEIDHNLRVSTWLQRCHPEPYPVDELPDLEWPDINYDDLPRPLTFEHWFLVTNDNNNSPTAVNNNLTTGNNLASMPNNNTKSSTLSRNNSNIMKNSNTLKRINSRLN